MHDLEMVAIDQIAQLIVVADMIVECTIKYPSVQFGKYYHN